MFYIIAIGILMLNIKVVWEIPDIGVKLITIIISILSMVGYMTRLLFVRATSMSSLITMQNFYFIPSLGITISLWLLLWYITPYLRQKINKVGLMILCMPWLAFYSLLVILQPYKIIKSQRAGYSLKLIDKWDLYSGGFQVSVMIILIICASYGWKLYKHQQIRSQYMVLIMCQLLLLVDGFTYFSLTIPVIPVFTLTEVFCLLAIYNGFSKPPIDARGIKRPMIGNFTKR